MAGFQIGLLFERADNVITVCEMKYSMTAIGTDIIPEMERKIQLLTRLKPGKTIQRVLISNLPPSEHLAASGYFFKTIRAEALIQPTRDFQD